MSDFRAGGRGLLPRRPTPSMGVIPGLFLALSSWMANWQGSVLIEACRAGRQALWFPFFIIGDQSMKIKSPAVHNSGAALQAAVHPYHTRCPDCQVAPGEVHQSGCDVERCPICGYQLHNCDCDENAAPLPWTGLWPGEAECREFGWYAKFTSQGWVSCTADEPGAQPDLNRLYQDALWHRELGRFVLSTNPSQP
jgi:hypothetical protein